MDMDMSSAYPHHWLSFSLSNNYRHGLLEAFSNSSSAPPLGEEGVVEESPKMEDFLGGVGGAGAPPATAAEDQQLVCGELGSIAAGFLRQYDPAPGAVAENPGAVTVAMSTDAAESDQARRPVETFGQRTSIYRGVTRHRWTGRYEAHLWDNSCRREGQSRKGRQVYLGGYDKEEKAARAYDLAALKYWGPTTTTNFPVSNYEKELEEMKSMTRQEFYWSLLALHYQQQQQQQFPASAYEAYGSGGVNVDFTMGTSSHSGSNTSSGVMWGAATTGAMGQQDSSSNKQGNSGYASNIPYAAAAMVSGSAGYEGSTGNNGTWVTSNTSTAPQYYNYLFGME
ncbi:hypothetical protein PVAP13_4NG265600 [Panicum virgatum]|uniref:AP2/ERF domain-containing protein n=1 Tax=Panicum virgatum TaxID=38727 RepID=A0A8T0TBN5_PANVG|nr:hypothetical protein PVAP13_4NG265600 [Panicum virgatum]